NWKGLQEQVGKCPQSSQAGACLLQKNIKKGTGGGSPSRSPSINSKMAVESATVNSTKYAGTVEGVATKLECSYDIRMCLSKPLRKEVINNLVSGSGKENKILRNGQISSTKMTTEDINKMQYSFFQKQNKLADVQIRSFTAMETFFK
ncbi:hypothetical protein MAR_038512, partial [Mya arenaria]